MNKKIFAISFLILAMIACNIASDNPTSAPEVLTVSPTPNPATPTTAVFPTQEIQTPTSTSLPPTSQPIQADSPNRIRFNAGGTWMDLQDNLNPGTSKTYHLNAMQGQVMSVSVLAGNQPGVWGYFPIEIEGSDGTVLCPVELNNECTFWRGKLPSTQDYFIKVKSGGDLINFTLRVAINPPGKNSQLFQYSNPTTGLALSYSDQFAPARFPSSANNKITPELELQFIDTNFYTNTNLGEVYFLLGSSVDPQIVAACTDPNPNGGAPEEVISSEKINGYNFVHSQAVGAGAGNIYDQEIYRLRDKGICYEVIYFIHYSNIGNYAPGVVTEFNMDELLQKLNGVLDTFDAR